MVAEVLSGSSCNRSTKATGRRTNFETLGKLYRLFQGEKGVGVSVYQESSSRQT